MFIFETRDYSGLEIIRLKNQKTGAFIEVIPELGGTVYQIRLTDPGTGDAVPVLAPDDPKDLRTNPLFRGRLLFPFNDRIPGGTYTFEGQTHHLSINSPEDQSSIHGLIYDQPMELKNLDLEEQWGCLHLNKTIAADDFPGYPYCVSLSVEYKLEEKGFLLSLSIKNTGLQTAPVALGWHPYFHLGEPIDNIRFQHGGDHFVEVDDFLLPTGGIRPVEGSVYDFRAGVRMGDRSLDIALTSDRKGRSFLFRERNILRMEYDPAFFKYTQIYTPEDRCSIAIEPVSAATNAFNWPELGLISLKPGEQKSASVRLSLMPTGDKS